MVKVVYEKLLAFETWGMEYLKKEFFCHIMYLLFMYQSTILYYVVFNKCKISYLQK